jgi:RNA polymerase sigma-70 factor (ECF subfamily)
MVEAADREVLKADLRDLGPVVAEHEGALQRIAERLCATTADARDLVQDTFERAMRQGIPGDVRSVRAWLTSIMHNLFIDRCRATARRPAHEPLDDSHHEVPPPPPADPEPAWSRVTVEDIRAALAELEPAFRDVYTLHTFDQLPYDAIARRLRIERTTVGTRLHRARKKLRELLIARFGLEVTP